VPGASHAPYETGGPGQVAQVRRLVAVDGARPRIGTQDSALRRSGGWPWGWSAYQLVSATDEPPIVSLWVRIAASRLAFFKINELRNGPFSTNILEITIVDVTDKSPE
jgi:hypothetical protein